MCPIVHVHRLYHDKVRVYYEAKEGVRDSLEEQFYLCVGLFSTPNPWLLVEWILIKKMLVWFPTHIPGT